MKLNNKNTKISRDKRVTIKRDNLQRREKGVSKSQRNLLCLRCRKSQENASPINKTLSFLEPTKELRSQGNRSTRFQMVSSPSEGRRARDQAEHRREKWEEISSDFNTILRAARGRSVWNRWSPDTREAEGRAEAGGAPPWCRYARGRLPPGTGTGLSPAPEPVLHTEQKP